MMQHILAVAVGGGIGAALRYAVTLLANAHGGVAFPYGTVLVNIIGSFSHRPAHDVFSGPGRLAAVGEALCRHRRPRRLYDLSTFNMELLTFIRAGEMGFALLYGGLNVVGAFLFCWLGLAAGTALW